MEHFRRKSLPALRYNAAMGGTYSGSTFIALHRRCIDACDDLRAGDRICDVLLRLGLVRRVL